MNGSEALHRLAEQAGVERAFVAMTGEPTFVRDDALRGILGAMGIPAATDADVATGLSLIPDAAVSRTEGSADAVCDVPDWLREGRCWGVACQVYSLRSRRNWGIGDFEDLGRFAELMANEGADFVGVNPLHALMLSAPERCSPFFPSSRRFLNPLYIAVDRVPGADRLGDALDLPDDVRAGELIDYARIGEIKRKALRFLYRLFEDGDPGSEQIAFAGFVTAGGRSLYLHALFEALSEDMVARGGGAGWHGWPEDYRDPAGETVRAFAREHAGEITFHSWLQWLADRQLANVQARALAAGMRIGLYVDLAVGVAPDGSDTWADRDVVVPGARIGAPPDYFNASGQDWGLAPFSPAALALGDCRPYREALDAVLRHAGAVRIDHAMSLYRLYWIARGFTATDGAYVRYPLQAMLTAVAEVSKERRAIIIGEDLGTVPHGFRDVLRTAGIQSYRVLFFEKDGDFFRPPEDYPREAMACITIHDLHTLAGWWGGHDIDTMIAAGTLPREGAEAARESRMHERRRLLGRLSDGGLLDPSLEPVMRRETEAPTDLPPAVAVAVHRLVARTPCRLFAVAAEDLAGATEQVNLPGTIDEHPNWRRRLPVPIEELRGHPLLRAITAALREERAKADG